jgi:hypothetical protein
VLAVAPHVQIVATSREDIDKLTSLESSCMAGKESLPFLAVTVNFYIETYIACGDAVRLMTGIDRTQLLATDETDLPLLVTKQSLVRR